MIFARTVCGRARWVAGTVQAHRLEQGAARRRGRGVPAVTDIEAPDEGLDDASADGEPSPADGEDGSRARPSLGRRLRRGGLKLALAILSVLVTLAVVEGVFRLLGYDPVYDVYSKPEEFFQADPVLGWSFTPGARDEYVGPRPFPIEFRTDVRINSLGLRGPELDPVPPGGLRVVVLGDSWVAGLEVAENRTYTSVLTDELTDRLGVPVQVVNAGVRGYGTDQVWLLYQERLRQLDPDLVFYHTTGNDPEDNTVVHRMHRVFSKPAFALEADGDLRSVGRPVRSHAQCSEYRIVDGEIRRIDGPRARALCWAQTRLSDHSAFFSFVTERIRGNPDLVRRLYGLSFPDDSRPPGADDDAADDPAAGGGAPTVTAGPPPAPAPGPPPALDDAHRLTSVLVEHLAADVRADGAGFVLVGHSNDLGALDLPAFDRDGIEIMRTDAALTDPDNELIPNDGHPNELGHRRIADVLADQLQPRLEEMTRR